MMPTALSQLHRLQRHTPGNAAQLFHHIPAWEDECWYCEVMGNHVSRGSGWIITAVHFLDLEESIVQHKMQNTTWCTSGS